MSQVPASDTEDNILRVMCYAVARHVPSDGAPLVVDTSYPHDEVMNFPLERTPPVQMEFGESETSYFLAHQAVKKC